MQAPDVTVTADASHTRADRRLASLDGLRGLAALSIFVFHGWLYTMPEPSATARSTVGDYAAHELRLGLVLFFVLSGFLLSRPWFAAALGERRPPSVGRYVRSRAARILPAYYVALGGSILLLWGLQGTPGLRLPPAGELPLFVVFGQNLSPGSVMKLNPPMWSLAVEVSFYAVLPAIGWLALRLPRRRSSLALVPLALLAVGVIYNWSIAGQGLSMTFSKTLAAMLPYFALGMLAALLAHGRTIDMATKRMLVTAGVALVVADAIAKAAAPARGLDLTMLFSIMRDLPSAHRLRADRRCLLDRAPQPRPRRAGAAGDGGHLLRLLPLARPRADGAARLRPVAAGPVPRDRRGARPVARARHAQLVCLRAPRAALDARAASVAGRPTPVRRG